MLIHGKQLADLEECDLQSLIDDKVAEGKNIEYKRDLPQNSDQAKKEFLADVSSFSNSAGGYIFFGMSEDSGLPLGIEGLGQIDPDAEILRFENLLRDSMTPRLPGVNIRAISITNQSSVLVVHIPKSWASPHMVTFKKSSKFFSRNSAGKYQLDVFELRTAFNATNIEGEHLRTFRIDRLGKIIPNEAPISIGNRAKVILHLIPISAFASGINYDLREFQLFPNREKLAPIGEEFGSNLRFNFDGLLTYEQEDKTEPANSYLQLFRNGIIESVSTSLFNHDTTPPRIPSITFEQELLKALERFFSIQNVLETEPPYFLFLTLLGVQGYNLSSGARTLDRNDLLVPEILIEDMLLPASTILRPAFDAVWNAAAIPQSPHYDAAGNWKPTR